MLRSDSPNCKDELVLNPRERITIESSLSKTIHWKRGFAKKYETLYDVFSQDFIQSRAFSSTQIPNFADDGVSKSDNSNAILTVCQTCENPIKGKLMYLKLSIANKTDGFCKVKIGLNMSHASDNNVYILFCLIYYLLISYLLISYLLISYFRIYYLLISYL